MLSKSLDLLREGPEQNLPMAECVCHECTNVFWVAVEPENEPRYCPYCGIKFIRVQTAEGENRYFEGQE